MIFDALNKAPISGIQFMVIFRPEGVEYEYQTTI
jgi:hypothetical protein